MHVAAYGQPKVSDCGNQRLWRTTRNYNLVVRGTTPFIFLIWTLIPDVKIDWISSKMFHLLRFHRYEDYIIYVTFSFLWIDCIFLLEVNVMAVCLGYDCVCIMSKIIHRRMQSPPDYPVNCCGMITILECHLEYLQKSQVVCQNSYILHWKKKECHKFLKPHKSGFYSATQRVIILTCVFESMCKRYAYICIRSK